MIGWNSLKAMPELLRRRFGQRRQLAALRSCGAPHADRLWKALERAANDRFSAEEKAWFTRIELRRDELALSCDVVTDRDYGAGLPDTEPTEAEMEQGREDTFLVGEQCTSSSLPPQWARVLYSLIREFKPAVCLEMGTSVGISALYQASALIENGTGRLYTLEGVAALAEVAGDGFRRLGTDTAQTVVGRFQDTLRDTLESYGPAGYAFIDGHHDEHATIAYFELIRQYITPGAVLVFDDISWSVGMRRAWEEIVSRPGVSLAVDLYDIGVIIMDDDASKLHRFNTLFQLTERWKYGIRSRSAHHRRGNKRNGNRP